RGGADFLRKNPTANANATSTTPTDTRVVSASALPVMNHPENENGLSDTIHHNDANPSTIMGKRMTNGTSGTFVHCNRSDREPSVTNTNQISRKRSEERRV